MIPIVYLELRKSSALYIGLLNPYSIRGGYYYYFCFTNWKTEAQEVKELA